MREQNRHVGRPLRDELWEARYSSRGLGLEVAVVLNAETAWIDAISMLR
jgi:hypothetical protein